MRYQTPVFRDARPAVVSGLIWLTAVINLVAQWDWNPPSSQARAATSDDFQRTAPRRDPQWATSQREQTYPIEPMWRVNTRYDAMIASVAREHGLDPALVKAMVQAESAFDPTALSVDGAQGLMQLLPETAARVGIRDLLNPYLNLQAGVRHLVYLLKKFDGDRVLSVAAYNAGEYAVRRHGGVPPFPETYRYLYRVFGLQSIYAEATPASTPAQPRQTRAANSLVAAAPE